MMHEARSWRTRAGSLAQNGVVVSSDTGAYWGPVLPGSGGVTWSQRPDTSRMLNLKSCELQSPSADALLAEALAGLVPSDLWRYPHQLPLLTRLSDDFGLDPEAIMLTAGSYTAIGAVVDALAVPRGGLVLQEPVFDAWTYFAELRQVPVRRCPGVVGTPPTATTAAFEDALCTSEPSVAAITNPGNPLGDLLPLEHVRRLAELAGEHGHLLVVDDCYGAFAGARHAELLAECENVLIIRSLSKTWGLAGARLAAVLGRPELIRYLQQFRLDSAVSAPALVVARRLSEMSTSLRAVRDEVVATREWYISRLRVVRPEWVALPSATNFVTLWTGAPGGGDATANMLALHDIRVRSVESLAGLAGCVRFSLAGRDAMERVLAVLATDVGAE